MASQLLLDLEVEPENLYPVPSLDEPRLELLGGSMGLRPSEERWSALWEYLVRRSSYEFDLWQRMYDQWKAAYGAFRALEQETLYSEDSSGQSMTPDSKDLQSHATAIPLLISAGEELQRILILLSEGRNNTDFKWLSEQTDLHTLLESLRESLALWHSPEPATANEIRAAFAATAAE
jgi:hypothetical protein